MTDDVTRDAGDHVIARLRATREAVGAGLHETRLDAADRTARLDIFDVQALRTGSRSDQPARRWAAAVSVAALAACTAGAVVWAGTAGQDSPRVTAARTASVGVDPGYTYVRVTTRLGTLKVVDEWWIPATADGTWRYDQIGPKTDRAAILAELDTSWMSPQTRQAMLSDDAAPVTVGPCAAVMAAAQCGPGAGSWRAPSRSFVTRLPRKASALRAQLDAYAAQHLNQKRNDDAPSGLGIVMPSTDPVQLDSPAQTRTRFEIGLLVGVLQSGYADKALDAAVRDVVARMPDVLSIDHMADADGRTGTGYSVQTDPAHPANAEALVFAPDATFLGSGAAFPRRATSFDAGAVLAANGHGGGDVSTDVATTSFLTASVPGLGDRP